MTLLEKFRQADKKVNEIEANGGLLSGSYGTVETTKEYDKALEEAQELYMELEKQGIYPF